MSEETTQNISGGDGRSFEERVFARFDSQDVMLRDFDARLQSLEACSYDTKPIWEQALKEIAETRNELAETRQELKRELVDTKRQLSRRLDRIELVIVETRSGVHDIEDRVDGIEGRVEKLEAKPTQ
ncbi:MAG TPA: hypothetical protein VD861_08350 [Pyrinomonadaceae bacterium]|nr:hypothetical protein [Pyrinomonadaceae bacterium]